jgi:acetolactate decarboxylase
MARDIIDDRLIGALHLRSLSRQGLDHDPVHEHQAVQAGTLRALMAGEYLGDATLDELLRMGDLGIGTVQQLGGELIVLDGEPWVAEADSSVHPVARDVKTPFAVVCRFGAEWSAALHGPMDLDAVRGAVDRLVPADAPVVAVRVEGRFRDLSLRSVARQSPPYVPLLEVVAHQTEWWVAEATGTLVGFRFPDATAGVEVPGYHLHFLADDRSTGGHVLGGTLVEGTAAADRCDDLHVELPAGAGLGVPGSADRAEIDRIEGAHAGGAVGTGPTG